MLKSKSGFTIVELLIVIVVIAILAAITIVAYNGIQDRGRLSSAQSDLRAISQAAEVYNIDNGSYPNNVTAWTEVFKTANQYNSTRSSSDKLFVICSKAGTYAIVAGSLKSTETSGSIWYYVSNTGLATFSYNTATTGTYAINRICAHTPANPIFYVAWSYQLP